MQSLISFLRLFYGFGLRYMLRHRWRTISVICGIALGASVFTSVRLAIHASMDSFSRSMERVAGRTDHTIVNPGGRVPEKLIRKLIQDPSIAALSPVLSTYVSPGKDLEEPFLLIGIDPILDRPFRSWTTDPDQRDAAIAWLNLIRNPGAIIISRRLADQYQVAAGDPFPVVHPALTGNFQVAGVLSGSGLGLAEGGLLAVTDIATFQEYSQTFGQVDRIDLILEKGATSADIRRIRNAIHPEAVLADPSETRKSGQRLIRAYQLNLSVLGFASLFVGMFLVYSLVSLNATARRPELAVLRSLGASRRTLFQLFLAEGLLFGITGWMIAIPVSTLGVTLMLSGISKTIATLFVSVRVEALSLSVWEIALSFGMTLLISGLAAYIPARQAMQVDPREVLSPLPEPHADPGTSRNPLQISVLCLLLMIPLSMLPGLSGFPLPGYLAVLLLFTGFSLVVPQALRHTARMLDPLIAGRFRIPGRLALRYIRYSGRRTAVSVGALITAVALFTALVVMIHSFRKTVEIWVTQTVSGDLFVSPIMADINQDRYLLDPETVAIIHQAEEDFTVVPLRRFHLNHSGSRFQLEATDLVSFARHGGFLWVQGDPEKDYAKAASGNGVLISEVMASQTGLERGDWFATHVSGVHLRLPVVGIIRDYRTQGGAVFCSLDFLNGLLHPETDGKRDYWSGARLFLKPHAAARSRSGETLNRLRNQLLKGTLGRLDVIPGPELRRKILQIFDETFAITFVLLLIALLVATLGIATTMTILVLERASQLNTLIAVGADRPQIRRIIFWEAGVMVVVGEILGLACGAILSFLLIYVITYQSFGWTFRYQIDWTYIWASLPLIFGAAFAAALPAIRLVFQAPPADLLRERSYG